MDHWNEKAESALTALSQSVRNLDLYEYQVEIAYSENDDRPQVRYTIAMPCTDASEELQRLLPPDKTGFAAVVAQAFFFHAQEKATRKMRKAVQPYLKRTMKAAKKIAKR